MPSILGKREQHKQKPRGQEVYIVEKKHVADWEAFFFGHSGQQLDVGSWFPNQGLNPGRSSERAKS